MMIFISGVKYKDEGSFFVCLDYFSESLVMEVAANFAEFLPGVRSAAVQVRMG